MSNSQVPNSQVPNSQVPNSQVPNSQVKVRTLPCGPTSLMFEVATVEEAALLAAGLRRAGLADVVEIVPGARTVLIVAERADALATVRAAAEGLEPERLGEASGDLVEVPLFYDGEDLAAVAEATGMSVADVIEMHSSTEYVAAFSGFTPGFAYLTGLPAELQLARRASPRSRVDAGSVAIGAEFTGVYPTSSPGGWHLLGRTEVLMWNPTRSRPAFVVPGDRVRFVAAPR